MRIDPVRSLIIASTMLMAALPTTAWANWQYTTWGQSPAELAAASNGAAVPNEDRGRDPGDYRADLKADYVGQGFEFVAYFVFDEAEKLIYVDLDPKQPDQCNDIRFALLNAYGKPNTTGSFGLLKWWHRDSGNVVIYSEIVGCDIRYMAYTAPSAKGGL